MVSNTETEGRITTDHDTIEQWADEVDAVPARHEGRTEPENLELVREPNLTDTHETLTWDEFFTGIDDSEMVVIAHQDDTLEVVEYDEVLRRSAVESEELEAALLEGEIITSTITETTVIERTVVEEATVESHITDREVVRDTYQDASLQNREVEGCEVTDTDTGRDEAISYEQFEPGAQVSDEFEVDVTVNESWSVTKDSVERLLIESEIVEAEATETDTVESDEIESTISVEEVQETILASEIIDTEQTPSELIESGSIQTEFTEGDVFETTLFLEKTVEEDISLTQVFSGPVTDGETVTVDIDARDTLSSDIVDKSAADVSTATHETEAPETETGEMTQESTERVSLSEDDEGKTVVDASGSEIGMVVEVEADTMYVDPHPSLTDKIKTALDWGGRDEDAYPVTASKVDRIEDDKVMLTIEGE